MDPNLSTDRALQRHAGNGYRHGHGDAPRIGNTPVPNKTVELTSTNPDALISPSSAPPARTGQLTFTVGDLTAESLTFRRPTPPMPI